MQILTIINTFILPCIVAILVLGIILNIRYTEKNVYRSYLLSMFSFWVLALLMVYVKFYVDGGSVISYTKDVASVQVLLLGIACFVLLLCYPVVILNANFLKLRNWLSALSPLLVAVILYFAWHLIAGEDPFVVYANFGELWANIATVSVILRLLLIIVFILFVVISLFSVWSVVPLYNNHVQENIANSDCNVGWIRKLVKYILLVTPLYFSMLFASNPVINFLYLSALLMMFGYIVRVTLFYRTSEHIVSVKIGRIPSTFFKFFIDNDEPAEVVCKDNFNDFSESLNNWMLAERPYSHIDFTTNDIIDNFPEIIHSDLVNHFKSRNETFQSYVRKYRIYRACEIIVESEDELYSKQIFSVVGFSHYSSFSRSFVAVAGCAPSVFKECTVDHQKAVMAAILAGIPPPPIEICYDEVPGETP